MPRGGLGREGCTFHPGGVYIFRVLGTHLSRVPKKEEETPARPGFKTGNFSFAQFRSSNVEDRSSLGRSRAVCKNNFANLPGPYRREGGDRDGMEIHIEERDVEMEMGIGMEMGMETDM